EGAALVHGEVIAGDRVAIGIGKLPDKIGAGKPDRAEHNSTGEDRSKNVSHREISLEHASTGGSRSQGRAAAFLELREVQAIDHAVAIVVEESVLGIIARLVIALGEEGLIVVVDGPIAVVVAKEAEELVRGVAAELTGPGSVHLLALGVGHQRAVNL